MESPLPNSDTQPLKRAFSLGEVLLAGVLCVLVALLVSWSTPSFDFAYDWLLAQALVHGIDPSLDLATIAHELGLAASRLDFIAPRLPGVLLLQYPYALIPFQALEEIGRILVALQSLAMFALCFRLVSDVRPLGSLLFTPLLLLFPPFSWVVANGQSIFIIGAAIAWSLLLIRRSDSWYGGIPLGLACLFKPFPWFLIPAFAAGKRPRAAIGAGVTFLAFNAAGLLLPNVSISGTWLALQDASRFFHHPGNISLSTLTGASPILIGTLALVFSVLAAQHLGHSRSLPIVLLVGLFGSPIFWPAYGAVLLVPFANAIARRSTTTVSLVVQEGN